MSNTDIPHLAFEPDGSYDVSTPEKRLAAAEATLRFVATIPIAYHARGPAFCRDEMARIAGETATLLQRTHEAETPPVTGETITDEQIRALWRLGRIDAAEAMDASGFDFLTGRVTTGATNAAARARCAAAYNARFGSRS